ncbi:alpha/beta fold hydrolase [Oleiharenicola sp. Vm1]|uniref:alpha/beta fold hydrolase n=1 Tax=Oleiharenicola sp. Vm1 TaxID=3398393 RepID=UPI0039F557D5
MKTLAAVALLFALPAFAAEARFVRDVEYGRAAGVSLKLDVDVPAGEGPFPVAILVHGGGWSSGSKAGSDKPGNGADITPWFAAFRAGGFVWFSIDYRLAPAHPWPAGYEDVLTAIRWVKAHAAEYGGDPRRIVLVGHSSGGHLACLAGVRPDADTRVQAVVGFAPVTDLVTDTRNRGGASTSLQALFGIAKELTPETEKRLRDVSPSAQVLPGLPPFLILHGDADKTVPIAMSRSFQEQLRAAGNTCDLIVLPGAPHGLLTWEKFLPDYAARMNAWLHSHLPAAAR